MEPVTNNVPPTVHTIFQRHSVDLPLDGYRHNLVHLTDNYYISLHTVTAPYPDNLSNFNHNTTLRLYTITDGQISLIGSDIINTLVVDRHTPTHELTGNPKPAALVRVDDDTIAVSYVRPRLG